MTSLNLSFPADFTIVCSKLNEPIIFKSTISLLELPTTVLDLKELMSEKLGIPIICMVQLSIAGMHLLDGQFIGTDIPLRKNDEISLLYLEKCEPRCLNSLKTHVTIITNLFDECILPDIEQSVKQLVSLNGTNISPVSKRNKLLKYLKLNKQSQNREAVSNSYLEKHLLLIKLTSTISNLSNFLTPWNDEKSKCCRLYLIQQGIIDNIDNIWSWALSNNHVDLYSKCMSTLWNFDENTSERLILLQLGSYDRAFEMLLDPNCDIGIIRRALGVLWGFAELSEGQKKLGMNENFLSNVAKAFNSTQCLNTQEIIMDILSLLASYYTCPKVMKRQSILEKIMVSSKPELNILSLLNLDSLLYNLCRCSMFLIRSPDYPLSDITILRKVIAHLTIFKRTSRDVIIARDEERRGTSWASMVHFIDLFFVPRSSPLYQYNEDAKELLDLYFAVARISLSSVLLQEKNRKMCLKEDLYGYLIILYWKYSHNIESKQLFGNLLKRFTPPPYTIPSLLQLSIAEYAFNTHGLTAALDLI